MQRRKRRGEVNLHDCLMMVVVLLAGLFIYRIRSGAATGEVWQFSQVGGQPSWEQDAEYPQVSVLQAEDDLHRTT
jgi:hypothetical protein